ncbi:MAG: lysophospholipid acyltransferase family protein, partial [Thermoanaerobaculia bacterium]|nr:lysophospholipid acyltransferase family protein [Thermoanaerobaculia bacterium]
MRRLLDLALEGLARLALGLFYRRIEVVGADRLPERGPAVYVGNHGNGIIDPALVMGWFPRSIRFLAKSTLWSQFPIGLFVRLAGAVKVFRQIDPGVDTSRNRAMFSACWEILARGGSLCLFPEGISHPEPHLMPLKTGAARIVLGALHRQTDLDLVVVPFGLVFEERERFRSRVLIEIGRPIDPRPWLTPRGERDQESVRALTNAIERSLAAVTLNFPSWREADLVRRAASLYVSDEIGRPP